MSELVKRHGHCRRRRTRHQQNLVLVDEGLNFLHRLIGLGGAVSSKQVDLLAEQTLVDLGRYLLEERIAVVDVLDCKLPTFEFIFSLNRVSAGTRNGRGDIDGVTLRACRPSANRRMIADRERWCHQHWWQQRTTGKAGAGLQQFSPRHCVELECF